MWCMALSLTLHDQSSDARMRRDIHAQLIEHAGMRLHQVLKHRMRLVLPQLLQHTLARRRYKVVAGRFALEQGQHVPQHLGINEVLIQIQVLARGIGTQHTQGSEAHVFITHMQQRANVVARIRCQHIVSTAMGVLRHDTAPQVTQVQIQHLVVRAQRQGLVPC